ncbi:MAG: hypothetical protein EOO80_01005 [Oxalobacteraceae bacterium]|nr:MAG: hypothetical protein EOO80_01005 [Oxalobacteraceae bacterium]
MNTALRCALNGNEATQVDANTGVLSFQFQRTCLLQGCYQGLSTAYAPKCEFGEMPYRQPSYVDFASLWSVLFSAWLVAVAWRMVRNSI